MEKITMVKMSRGVMGELGRRRISERPINIEILQVGKLYKEPGRRLLRADLDSFEFAEEEPI